MNISNNTGDGYCDRRDERLNAHNVTNKPFVDYLVYDIGTKQTRKFLG